MNPIQNQSTTSANLIFQTEEDSFLQITDALGAFDQNDPFLFPHYDEVQNSSSEENLDSTIEDEQNLALSAKESTNSSEEKPTIQKRKREVRQLNNPLNSNQNDADSEIDKTLIRKEKWNAYSKKRQDSHKKQTAIFKSQQDQIISVGSKMASTIKAHHLETSLDYKQFQIETDKSRQENNNLAANYYLTMFPQVFEKAISLIVKQQNEIENLNQKITQQKPEQEVTSTTQAFEECKNAIQQFQTAIDNESKKRQKVQQKTEVEINFMKKFRGSLL